MAILKKSQIRELSPQERKEKLKQLRQQLSRERGLISSGASPENSGRIKEIKRTIARILTQENSIRGSPLSIQQKGADSLSNPSRGSSNPKGSPAKDALSTTGFSKSKDSPPSNPIKINESRSDRKG